MRGRRGSRRENEVEETEDPEEYGNACTVFCVDSILLCTVLKSPSISE